MTTKVNFLFFSFFVLRLVAFVAFFLNNPMADMFASFFRLEAAVVVVDVVLLDVFDLEPFLFASFFFINVFINGGSESRRPNMANGGL